MQACSRLFLLLTAWLFAAFSFPSQAQTPENFKIAFIGDSGIDDNAKAVLNLIKDEGADAVLHAGDLDYLDDPETFENHVNDILGASYPYIYSVGNHDRFVWDGDEGYQAFLEARFNRLGIPWSGRLGVKSSFMYKGIFFIAVAPNEMGVKKDEAGEYIRDQLANNETGWRIALWHKNQTKMQVGGKSDEAGWRVYEEARIGGAIMATGHEHSYSRTHLMSHMENLTVASTSDTLVLARDDPSTDFDEGRSFAFVSGLGGNEIRDQEQFDSHWAAIYSSTQNATYGALFGEFNYQGQGALARFYFKDIDGEIQDAFYVRTTVDKDLPVEMVSFDAITDGNNARLSWQTATETNNAGFDVQRLGPNASWERIAFVTGHGTTTEPQTYSYTFKGLSPGTHRFRLKQIDFDGTFSLSEEVNVTVLPKQAFQVSAAFPNPFSPKSQFTILVAREQTVTATLYDMLGREVQLLFNGWLPANTPHQVEINGSDLSEGVYFYRVNGATFSTTRRVLIGH